MKTGLALEGTAGNNGAATETWQGTPEEKALVSLIEGHWKDRERSKRQYEKTWFTNHAAVVGQHWLVWNDYTRDFNVPQRLPGGRRRLTIPYMMVYHRRTVARLTARRPAMFVMPATTEEKDVACAKVNMRVLEGEFERLGFQTIYRDAVGWAIESGNVILHPRWNPWVGPLLWQEQPQVDPFTGEPVLGPDGAAVIERVPVTDESGRQLQRGDLELEVVSPFEFDADPKATTLEGAEWCMRSSIRSITWVREQYPEAGQYVKPQSVYANNYYFKRVKNLVGSHGYAAPSSQGDSDEGIKDSTVVHEYWERPSRRHPDGRLVVIASGVVLHNGVNPYKRMIAAGMPFPFVHTGEIRIVGRFWYMAVIEQAFPLNKNLNRARSQEAENREFHGRPKILVPRIAKVAKTAFDAEAGEKVEYSPGPNGERPEMIYPQSTSAATQVEIAHSLSDLQEALSMHEVSRGVLPSANLPAEGIAKLQAADETSLGQTEANLREALIRMSRMMLAIIAENWTEARLVRVAGEAGRVEASRIKGADLYGEEEGDYHDVRMVPQSSMWRDPQEQRKLVADLIAFQVINPATDRDIILKALDLASIEHILKKDEVDEAWAHRENEILEAGQPLAPRDFENHAVHLRIHDAFRKSNRYRELPPQVQAIADAHAEAHKNEVIKLMQKATVSEMAAEAPKVAAEAVLADADAEQQEAAAAEQAEAAAAPVEAQAE